MKKSKSMKAGRRFLVFGCITAILCMMFPVRAYASDAGISIDGYYSDWEDKPMSTLTWNNNNGEAHHDVSLVKDDSNIYIYLGMHPSYKADIPIYEINLYINDKECHMFLAYANAQNTTDWSRTVDLKKKGIYTDLHPFTSYPNNSLGDAAVTVSPGNPRDRFEIRVSIQALEQVMGLKEGTINSGSTIKLGMPNVGGGTIELVGTPTGPVIGIALCIITVIAVFWFRRKKARLLR